MDEYHHLKCLKYPLVIIPSWHLFIQSTVNKWKDSLETRAELAVLWTYVENQAMLEPILLYGASKCKQTKGQGSEDCL